MHWFGDLASRAGLAVEAAALALALLLTAFVAVVLLVRPWRRRPSATAYRRVGTLAETWGVGGPSYAPQPVTIGPARIEPPAHATRRADTLSAILEGIGVPPNAARPGTLGLGLGPIPVRTGVGAGPARPSVAPDGLDISTLLRTAEESFGRVQSASDRADLDELRRFTTDAMFDLLSRPPGSPAGIHRTEVIRLESALLGIETGESGYLASVRLTGLLRVDGEPEGLDEIWNLTRPVEGSAGWLVAGIQPLRGN
jgi:predicted lipid-binding transport protein (Tim44 family)